MTTNPRSHQKNTPPGPAVDASGQSTIDPSENAKALNAASVQRLNDLRDVDLDHLRDLLEWTERLRAADIRFYDERDRRLTEVATEREKALKIKDEGVKETARIKEDADKEARELARESQRYKDEQANKLREQITAERGEYPTRAEFQPIADFVTAQQTRNESAVTAKADEQQGRSQSALNINVLIAALALFATVLIYVRG